MRPMNDSERDAFLQFTRGGSLQGASRSTKQQLRQLGFVEWQGNQWQLTERGTHVAEQFEEDFHEHVEALYGHYGVDTLELPSADEILGGTAALDKPLAYDQQVFLLQEIMEFMWDTWHRYGSKVNVITNAQVERANEFLLAFPEELRVFYMRSMYYREDGASIETAYHGRAEVHASWINLHHEFIGLDK